MELALVGRGVYESVDVRAAMHPSENEDYLLTRVIAYALCYEDGLEFSKGLCDPDESALKLLSPGGELLLSVEIGNPSARRLHKAAKAARRVAVFTYKDPEIILRECEGEKVHRAEDIEITAVDPRFLKELAGLLDRDNEWNVLFDEGVLTIASGDQTLTTSLRSLRLL
jgi:uncharacterized protein YaeQ